MIRIDIHIDERVAKGAAKTTSILFGRKTIIAGLIVALIVPVGIWAATISLPHTFTAGTPAVASEVNTNFTTLETAVNNLDGRINTLENFALTSAAGQIGYAASNNLGGLLDSFNSTNPIGGVSEVYNGTGWYEVAFDGINCEDGTGNPTGVAIATAQQFGEFCITGVVGVTAGSCEVVVRCFDDTGAAADSFFNLLLIL